MSPLDTRTDRRLGWGLLAAATLQAVAPVVQAFADVRQPSDGSEDLMVTPAGWTFSIWGLIYTLAVIHAAVTVWRHDDGVGGRRLALDLIVLYLGAAVWIAVSATGVTWATFVVLAIMTWFAIDAARLATRARPSRPVWIGRLARATSGVFAGWVSAAVFLNLGTAALDLDLVSGRVQGWQIALLAGAAIFALGVNLLMPRSPGYAAAVIWAQVGVMSAVAGRSDAALTVSAVAIVLLVAQTVFLWTRPAID